jgi:hypothetical protein
MDTVVQLNAASAEEYSGASAEMNSQAKYVKNIVGDMKYLVEGQSRGMTNTKEVSPVAHRLKAFVADKEEIGAAKTA